MPFNLPNKLPPEGFCERDEESLGELLQGAAVFKTVLSRARAVLQWVRWWGGLVQVQLPANSAAHFAAALRAVDCSESIDSVCSSHWKSVGGHGIANLVQLTNGTPAVLVVIGEILPTLRLVEYGYEAFTSTIFCFGSGLLKSRLSSLLKSLGRGSIFSWKNEQGTHSGHSHKWAVWWRFFLPSTGWTR